MIRSPRAGEPSSPLPRPTTRLEQSGVPRGSSQYCTIFARTLARVTSLRGARTEQRFVKRLEPMPIPYLGRIHLCSNPMLVDAKGQ